MIRLSGGIDAAALDVCNQVTCWECNHFGQINIPCCIRIQNVIAVCCGFGHWPKAD
jgi:hypothetical protein